MPNSIDILKKKEINLIDGIKPLFIEHFEYLMELYLLNEDKETNTNNFGREQVIIVKEGTEEKIKAYIENVNLKFFL